MSASPGPVDPRRVRALNRRPERRGGRYVLYWMQASQRMRDNHALLLAASRADAAGVPLLVVFCLMPYAGAAMRHYRFMIDGLRETARDLEGMGAKFVVRRGAPAGALAPLLGGASLLVADAGYLRAQREWRSGVARACPCACLEVETDVVVPARAASDHPEYSAATLRRKLLPLLPGFLKPVPRPFALKRDARGLDVEGLDPGGLEQACRFAPPFPGPVAGVTGGPGAARKRMAAFLASGLDAYAAGRMDPSLDAGSHLSAYLHFGHLSALALALRVREAGGPGANAFLEQLIVRRELAVNFALYSPACGRYEGLPEWARDTLLGRARDPRAYRYAPGRLERADTHDPYWNAAQTQLAATGRMHGVMRMYWGKKLLEWSRTPRQGFALAMRLNDRYALDGRDPNGCCGVAWCWGLHDRPHPARPVYGLVRSMTAAGLERKYDMKAYLERVRRQAARAAGGD